MRSPRGRGFTLIEMVVVVAIIAVLVGLILPAVVASRSAARRAECLANLKQIGEALANHHSALNAFPTAMRPDRRSRSPSAGLGAWAYPVSAQIQLLPFLENMPLYNAFNLEISVLSTGRDPVVNRTGNSTVLNVFLCPADPLGARPPSKSLLGVSPPGNSYRACDGPNPNEFEKSPVPGGGGAFPGLDVTTARDFTDGLSSTVGFSERVMGSGEGGHFHPRRDVWLSNWTALDPYADADTVLAICASLSNPNPGAYLTSGWFWTVGGYGTTMYNHVDTPESRRPDCSAGYLQVPVLPGGSISARSWHSGGVNVLFMDGSATFVKASVNLKTWRALATRAGGEVVGSAF